MDDNPIGAYIQDSAPTNVVPLSVPTTWPSGKVSKTTPPQYDPGFTYYVYNFVDGSASAYPALYGVPTLQTSSDYGQGAAGGTLKQVATTPLWLSNATNAASYLTANMLDLPASVVAEDGSGNKGAQSGFAYDDPGQLKGTPTSPQHVVCTPDVQ